MTKASASARAHVGGGQIAGVLSQRTGGPGSYAIFWNLIRKAHLARLKPVGIQRNSGFHARSDPRLFSGCRTCRFKRITSVHGPEGDAPREFHVEPRGKRWQKLLALEVEDLF